VASSQSFAWWSSCDALEHVHASSKEQWSAFEDSRILEKLDGIFLESALVDENWRGVWFSHLCFLKCLSFAFQSRSSSSLRLYVPSFTLRWIASKTRRIPSDLCWKCVMLTCKVVKSVHLRQLCPRVDLLVPSPPSSREGGRELI